MERREPVPRGGGVLAPGLIWVACVTALAVSIEGATPGPSASVVAMCLGVAAGAFGWAPPVVRPGTRFAARYVLRGAIVLLGFRLAFRDLAGLGARGIAIVVVALSFWVTRWAGDRARLGPGVPLLLAAGVAICGVSAVMAVAAITDSDDRDVATSVAAVTICGTIAMLLLPMLREPLGLGPTAFGWWAGASVHDVGQAAATASLVGDEALNAAVIVKLTRVSLLAPLVVLASISASPRSSEGRRGSRRPRAVPPFVIGFLLAISARSLGLVPDGAARAIGDTAGVALAAALAGLGAGIDVRRLRGEASRALAFALVASAVVAGLAYAGVRVRDL